MNSFEQIIKNKLGSRLNEMRREIASTLVTEALTIDKDPTKNSEADLSQKRKAKQDQIAVLQARIQELKTKTSTAKDPQAMNDRLQVMGDKLKQLQQELSIIR